MFSLSGRGSVLTEQVFPPIDVGDNEYEIGLVDLSTFHSIPNIEKDVNDSFYYGDEESPSRIVISEGSYEIDDLEHYIKNKLGRKIQFSLTANNNTLKAEIKCGKKIRFDQPNSIAKLLGFEEKALDPDTTHASTGPINIIKVNTIRVECNIVRGTYENGIEGHVIHAFYPLVAPGFKIVEIPTTIIYLPLNVRRINNITVLLKDQDGNLINFRNELVSLRLHLRRRRNGVSI